MGSLKMRADVPIRPQPRYRLQGFIEPSACELLDNFKTLLCVVVVNRLRALPVLWHPGTVVREITRPRRPGRIYLPSTSLVRPSGCRSPELIFGPPFGNMK